jgi:DNA-binding MarR family transcriptional regulator
MTTSLKEVGSIAARHDNASAATAGRMERDRFPDLVDRSTIAIESLRTQWRTIAELGIHERMAISQLRVHGPMPMSELAARISLSRAAVTSLVDRLESSKWVVRVSDEHDRRRTVLQLLPQATTSYDQIASAFYGELVEWSETMSDAEWRTIASFLDRLAVIAERRSDELRATALERSLS